MSIIRDNTHHSDIKCPCFFLFYFLYSFFFLLTSRPCRNDLFNLESSSARPWKKKTLQSSIVPPFLFPSLSHSIHCSLHSLLVPPWSLHRSAHSSSPSSSLSFSLSQCCRQAQAMQWFSRIQADLSPPPVVGRLTKCCISNWLMQKKNWQEHLKSFKKEKRLWHLYKLKAIISAII